MWPISRAIFAWPGYSWARWTVPDRFVPAEQAVPPLATAPCCNALQSIQHSLSFSSLLSSIFSSNEKNLIYRNFFLS